MAEGWETGLMYVLQHASRSLYGVALYLEGRLEDDDYGNAWE